MTAILAILNVTPDSFSDGGRLHSVSDAVDRGVELFEQGADIIDVGGESTRPGATRVPESEEQARVIPVVKELVAAGVPVSVDTMNASTALLAAEVGARIINDVSGGTADPGMYRVIAETGVIYIVMHSRGEAGRATDYTDVVAEVRHDLKARMAELIVSGVDPGRVVLDPGIGFAKNPEHNWALLGHLDELATLGHPILVGASRKRFLSPWGEQPAERDAPTAIVTALAARSGVWGVRVHDVPSTRIALGVAEAWTTGATS